MNRILCNNPWLLWCPAHSHSQEFTLILPLWLCLNQKHIAWPFSASAYYMWVIEQNAQGGLNLHHHSINRKYWCPGRCVAYHETTLQNTHIQTTHKQCANHHSMVHRIWRAHVAWGGYQLKWCMAPASSNWDMVMYLITHIRPLIRSKLSCIPLFANQHGGFGR